MEKNQVLKIKSRATKIFDFTQIDINEYIPEYTVDEKILEKDLNRILGSYGTKVEADQVENGDMVMISCQSEMPRYNKNKLMVMVGKGLYSKELESQLSGRKRGEEIEASVDGKPVKVTIHSVKRNQIPELTDENVASFSCEAYKNVKELKAFCVDKQIVRYLDEGEDYDMASAYVWKNFSESCEFELDPKEEARAMEEAAIQTQKMEDMLPVFDSPEEEEAYIRDYQEEFGENPMKMDMSEFAAQMCIITLKIAAVGQTVLEQEGNLVTQADYDTYIGRWMDAQPAMKREEIMSAYPVEYFLKEHYNNIIGDRIDAFILETFQKKMNPYR